jgi:L-seryl-tRNA(Ser) seleniumtransferase
MIRLSKEAIALRAARLAQAISAHPGFSATLRDGESVIGGGSTPGQTLATSLVAVRHTRYSAAKLEAMLRCQRPAIVGRVEQDEFIIDLRTVREDQDGKIAQAIQNFVNS